MFGRKKSWEILVPYHDNSGNKFPIEYHWQWDEKVREIAGGLTVFQTAKGQWCNQDGIVFKDVMIPVRIMCTKKDISHIVDMTIQHYQQEAVMWSKATSNTYIRYAPKPSKKNNYDNSKDKYIESKL